jgi:hypothetical protein
MSLSRQVARCACGSVEFQASGTPILAAACYCDDCQQGARQIAALPNGPVAGDDGGTEYLLYRKDRVTCTKGSELLRKYRLKDSSPTVRTLANCCNTALLLDFEKGHWLSLYRARFIGTPPPLQIRIQTKFAANADGIADDLPRYSSLPFRFMMKLISARFGMLFG